MIKKRLGWHTCAFEDKRAAHDFRILREYIRQIETSRHAQKMPPLHRRVKIKVILGPLLCRQCGHKFFTDRDLFPDHCPKCKSDRFVEAVGFLCPKDQQVTIIARGPNAVACEKCRAPVDSLKLPRQSEFQAWGALKAEKSQISGSK